MPNNYKRDFLKAIENKVNNEFISPAEEQQKTEERLENIRDFIAKKCEVYIHLDRLKQFKSSNMTIDLIHFQNTLAQESVLPISPLLIIAFLYNEKLLKKKERQTRDSVISAFFVDDLLYPFLMNLYDKHNLKNSLYSDMPIAYKNLIDCECSQRNIEILPTDTIKNVLEKSTHYEEYKNKRVKTIAKGLSWYGLFANSYGPKQIILDYAINEEVPLIAKI